MGQASERSVQGSLWKVWWRGRDQVLQRSTSWSTVHHWECCCQKLMEGYTLWEFHKRGSTLGGAKGWSMASGFTFFLSLLWASGTYLPLTDQRFQHTDGKSCGRQNVLWGRRGGPWPHQHRKPREKYQPLDGDWPVTTSLWNPSTQYVMNQAL